MIRLIVTDLDGSLLDGRGQLPADFAEVFGKMRAAGVEFAVASGRYYRSVAATFAPWFSDMCAVTDNGACVAVRGEVAAQRFLPREKYLALLAATEDLPDVERLTCAEDGMYYARLSGRPEFAGHDAFLSAEGKKRPLGEAERVLKVAFSDLRGPRNNTLPRIRDFLERGGYAYAVSSARAIDVMDGGCDKGEGIAVLQQRLGIAPEECAAFGDHENDVSMFARVKYSFAMANSSEEIKSRARAVCPAHTEGGVTRTILKILEENAIARNRKTSARL